MAAIFISVSAEVLKCVDTDFEQTDNNTEINGEFIISGIYPHVLQNNTKTLEYSRYFSQELFTLSLFPPVTQGSCLHVTSPSFD